MQFASLSPHPCIPCRPSGANCNRIRHLRYQAPRRLQANINARSVNSVAVTCTHPASDRPHPLPSTTGSVPAHDQSDDLDWVRDAVFYQIFPDRFARSSTAHPSSLQFQEWGAVPTLREFQGGHLLGVVEKLPYLQDLGVNAIYLCPIFTSSANHRYHITDFLSVDPLLGGDEALDTLLEEAHKRGMRVVLDGVFNHTGRGHPAFISLLENGETSPYADWFRVHSWPVQAYGVERGEANFDCWWDIPELPELNYDSPGVREHILHVARYWLERGVDGWRLDAPFTVPMDFWKQFHDVCKATRSDAYLVGETFGLEPKWCGDDCFDGVMNYPFGALSMGFFGQAELAKDAEIGGDYFFSACNGAQFRSGITAMHSAYASVKGPLPTYLHMNLFESHDTARALHLLDGDAHALRLCVLFQMTMPGPPMLYYGTEIAMTGGRDPLNRGAFPWDEPARWDRGLLEFYKAAIALRRDHAALRTGGYAPLPMLLPAAPDGPSPAAAPASALLPYTSDQPPAQDVPQVHAFARWTTRGGESSKSQQVAVVIFNSGPCSIENLAVETACGGGGAGDLFRPVWSSPSMAGAASSSRPEAPDASGGALFKCATGSTAILEGITVPARSVVVYVNYSGMSP